jgi:hypothetical protein
MRYTARQRRMELSIAFLCADTVTGHRLRYARSRAALRKNNNDLLLGDDRSSMSEKRYR